MLSRYWRIRQILIYFVLRNGLAVNQHGSTRFRNVEEVPQFTSNFIHFTSKEFLHRGIQILPERRPKIPNMGGKYFASGYRVTDNNINKQNIAFKAMETFA